MSTKPELPDPFELGISQFGPRHEVIRSGERGQDAVCIHLRELVFRRDGGRCRFCAASTDANTDWGRFEIDHITPWSAGGKTVPANLQLLCQRCNQDKGNRVNTISPRPPIVVGCAYCNPDVEHGETRAWCARCQSYASVPWLHVSRSDRFLSKCCDATSWLVERPNPRLMHEILHTIFYFFDEWVLMGCPNRIEPRPSIGGEIAPNAFAPSAEPPMAGQTRKADR